MRTALLSIFTFLVIALGGYSIAWYVQASHVKSTVERTIALVNQQQTYITYESLGVSGFPTDVMVTIAQPRFKGSVDTALRQLIDNTPTAPNAYQSLRSLPDWREDVQLDGSIVLGINALSDRYRMRISGDVKQNGIIKGKAVATNTQSTGDTSCVLQMQRQGGLFGSLWNFGTLVRDGNDFARDFRSLDCALAPSIVTDAGSKEKISESGGGRIYMQHTPEGEARAVRFYIKTSNEITPLGDAVINAYLSALNPANTFPPQFSVYGKQDLEVDFTYNGPANLANGIQNAPMEVNLSKFDITNSVYETHANLLYNNGMTGPNRAVRFSFKADSSFTPQYDTLLKQLVFGSIKNLYVDPDAPRPPQVAAFVRRYTPEQFYTLVAPAIPTLSSLGKLSQLVDLTYQGNAELTAGDFNLTALELAAAPYGIKGNGNAKTGTGNIPAGNLTLSCRNCPQLVDDAVNYGSRVQTVASYFEPQAAATPITPQSGENLKAFLLAVAGGTDPAMQNFEIVSNAQGVTVNGKTLQELMALYTRYFQPVQAAPANDNATVPPAAAAPVQPGAGSPATPPAAAK